MLAHADLGRHEYGSLRYLLYGGAPMSVQKLREALHAFGPVMAQAYGQSEALMMCTYLSPEDHVRALAEPALRRRIASAGREGPLSRIAIMGERGELLPPEERGEIVLRAEYVMDGYFQQPAATAEVSRDGWHLTGDVGFQDADGYVHLVDRKRDLIISGGFNVYPAEVEQAALAHPAVQDCAVVGEPHEKWGEAVLAVVELKSGAPWDEAAFLSHCRERLGGVKAPKRVEVWPALPRSGVGKVLRREVRQRFWAGHDRHI
jgi:acyl-CoA synthetase (AMP-forming)/AMP-acid ligase II